MRAELRRELELASRKAVTNAYCPYSRFPVGAALADELGRVYSGCNVENASFGLTICAERNALFQLVASGGKTVIAVMIYTPTPTPTAPCGACRQVIREFGPSAEILALCDGPDRLESTMAELLPCSFGPDKLDVNAVPLDIPNGLTRPCSAERPRICVDIDNVVAKTDAVMRSVILEVTEGRVDLSYEDISCFNYWECADRKGGAISRDEWKLVHEVFSEPRFLTAIEPVDEVQGHLATIAEHFNLHLATSRLPQARTCTVEWLEKHAFPSHDLHFLRHGEKHVALGRFAVSVEDDLEQAEAFADTGVTVSYVFAHPWNVFHGPQRNLVRVAGWPDLIRDLMLRIQLS
jgi:cytidine deaminase